jgi:hypothetical protein
MVILEIVSDPRPLSGDWRTPDAAIISFDILLYFQHIARVIDFGCPSEEERFVARNQS